MCFFVTDCMMVTHPHKFCDPFKGLFPLMIANECLLLTQCSLKPSSIENLVLPDWIFLVKVLIDFDFFLKKLSLKLPNNLETLNTQRNMKFLRKTMFTALIHDLRWAETLKISRFRVKEQLLRKMAK